MNGGQRFAFAHPTWLVIPTKVGIQQRSLDLASRNPAVINPGLRYASSRLLLHLIEKPITINGFKFNATINGINFIITAGTDNAFVKTFTFGHDS